MSQIFRLPRQIAVTSAGVPIPNARAKIELTGTSTLATVYTDEALTIPGTNPIVADAAGVFPLRWLDESIAYKLTLTTAANVTIYPAEDPAFDPQLSQADLGAILYRRTDAERTSGVTPTNYAYPPGDVRRYGAIGDNATDCTAAIQSAVDSLPSSGGRVSFPEGVFRFSGLVLDDKQVDFGGVLASIGENAPDSPTTLAYTGAGIALDVRTGARGSKLHDFQLTNVGTGTIGLLVNYQDPRIERVFIYQEYDSTTYAGFSVAGIRVGSLNQVNDLLLRDIYVRQQPALGVDLWEVSEGTLDHCRVLLNKGFQWKIGDTAGAVSSNGLNFVNGTTSQTANHANSGSVKIERAAFKTLFSGMQFEHDSVNGSPYAIDASAAVVADHIIVRDSFFNGKSWGGQADYAISINQVAAVLVVDSNLFYQLDVAAVENTAALAVYLRANQLITCPADISPVTTNTQRDLTGVIQPSLGTINASTVSTFTITVTGAQNTDYVSVNPSATSPGAGLVWSSRVSAPDTVEVRVANPTGGNVTTTDVNWYARVHRP